MSEEKTNVMRILDQKKVAYTPHWFDPKGALDGGTAAALLGKDPATVCKTLVTQGASKKYYVFVIPVAAELDLKAAAAAVSEKSVEMLHVKDLERTTGYIRGGCSPIGMKKAFRTVIDASAENLETIVVSGGKIGFQMELAPDDLRRAAKASFEEITFA